MDWETQLKDKLSEWIRKNYEVLPIWKKYSKQMLTKGKVWLGDYKTKWILRLTGIWVRRRHYRMTKGPMHREERAIPTLYVLSTFIKQSWQNYKKKLRKFIILLWYFYYTNLSNWQIKETKKLVRLKKIWTSQYLCLI